MLPYEIYLNQFFISTIFRNPYGNDDIILKKIQNIEKISVENNIMLHKLLSMLNYTPDITIQKISNNDEYDEMEHRLNTSNEYTTNLVSRSFLFYFILLRIKKKNNKKQK